MWRIQNNIIKLKFITFLTLLITLTTNHCAIIKRACRLSKEPYRSFTVYCNNQKSVSMIESGEVSFNCTVSVECDEKFTMKNVNTNVSCIHGKWNTAIPRCKSIKTCPNLQVRDSHTILECSAYNENIKCNDKLFGGTIVKQKCGRYFKLADSETDGQIECKANGEWSRSLSECVPDCGKINTFQNSEHLSPEEAVGDSPWHVALYKNDTRTSHSTAGKLLICGATIVSEYVVITDGVTEHVSGWGFNENSEVSEVSVKVELPYVSYTSCVEMATDSDKGSISVGTFCGGNNSDAAISKGDSGGGFIFFHPINKTYYLKGITSAKLLGLESGIFTDLSKHENFIQKILEEAKIGHASDLNREIFGSCSLQVNETDVKLRSECEPVYYDDNFHVPYVPNPCEVIIICNKGSSSTASSVCTNGKWTPDVAQCIIPTPPTISIPNGSTCKVPADSKKERYWATCDNVNGTIASVRNANQGCKLHMRCSSGYSFYNSTTNVAVCSGNNWFQEVPHCRRVCSLLNLDNIEISCYEGDTKIRCNKLLLSGTTVKPKCKPHFIKESRVPYGEIECNESGQWNHLLFKCIPECGVVTKGIQKLIVNGTKEEYGDSPWHVAMYILKDKSTTTLQCGGTIVHQRLVITAAHCFEDDKTQLDLDVNKYEIAVSKISRSYSSNDNRFQRKYKIKQVLLPEKGFHGVSTNYAADIALVILNEKIMLNQAVLPACVDLSNSHFNPSNGSPGKVVGWGYNDTTERTVSEHLLAATIPYISYDSCIDLLPIGGKYLLSVDKFCAGNVTGPGVRAGDSGGGLLFRDYQSFYYLRGVVSVKLNDAESSIGMFTDISYYSSWISSVINNVEREELNEETTLKRKT